MILVFGGAYQGKLDYVRERFELSEEDIYFCGEEDSRMPQGKSAVYELDKWVLALVKANKDVMNEIAQFEKLNPDAVVICNDISCGVVSVCPIFRKWREETGRAMGRLAQCSDEVVRLFCAIPTRLK